MYVGEARLKLQLLLLIVHLRQRVSPFLISDTATKTSRLIALIDKTLASSSEDWELEDGAISI